MQLDTRFPNQVSPGCQTGQTHILLFHSKHWHSTGLYTKSPSFLHTHSVVHKQLCGLKHQDKHYHCLKSLSTTSQQCCVRYRKSGQNMFDFSIMQAIQISPYAHKHTQTEKNCFFPKAVAVVTSHSQSYMTVVLLLWSMFNIILLLILILYFLTIDLLYYYYLTVVLFI